MANEDLISSRREAMILRHWHRSFSHSPFPGAATPLRLHAYFYYNVDGDVWYCVDTTGAVNGVMLEYGCSISEVPNPDTATEGDYVDAQIAKDSIARVIDSYFKAE